MKNPENKTGKARKNPSCSGFFWILPGSSGFRVLQVFPGSSGFFRVLQGFSGFLDGFSRFFTVFPGFQEKTVPKGPREREASSKGVPGSARPHPKGSQGARGHPKGVPGSARPPPRGYQGARGDLVQIWFRFGSDLVQIWFRLSSGVVQVWINHLIHVA